MSDEAPRRPGPPFSGKRNEPREVSRALRGVMGPLLRQVRKYQTYHACLAVLDEIFSGDLEGLAAPLELRLTASQSSPQVTDNGSEGGSVEVHALIVLVANQTVDSVIRQRSRQIVERINSKLQMPTVEELRCEIAPLAKVQKQLEILRLSPE